VLKNPNDPIARRVDSLANYFSAMICAMTNQQPGAVCTSAGVTAAQAQLPT
jgi:hypothetical protein